MCISLIYGAHTHRFAFLINNVSASMFFSLSLLKYYIAAFDPMWLQCKTLPCCTIFLKTAEHCCVMIWVFITVWESWNLHCVFIQRCITLTLNSLQCFSQTCFGKRYDLFSPAQQTSLLHFCCLAGGRNVQKLILYILVPWQYLTSSYMTIIKGA